MRPLLPALAVSAAVVLGAPYIGQVREAVQAALPRHYRAIVVAVVAFAVAAALGAALLRVRDRRPLRYALIGTAIAIAAGYAFAIRTGNVDQDVVEQFHFVQYGFVTFLYHRAWRWMDDGTALLLPLCAGIVVGVGDEAFQWFVPSRVGELHDVLINAVASLSGVLFSAGLHPPRTFALAGDAHGRRLLACGVSAALLALAAFVDVVHVGHEIRGDAVVFRSTFAADALVAAAQRRAEDWRTAPPATAPGFAREDHYLSEGQWHVQRRNEAAQEGDGWSAWNENRILEAYFAPVLALGAAWPPEQRDALAAAAPSGAVPYVSHAEPYPVYTISHWLFRGGTAAVVMVLVLVVLGARPAPRIPHQVAV